MTDLAQRDKHYTFEDVKSSSGDANTTALSTKEWLEAVDRAKEFVKAQKQERGFQSDDAMSSGMLSHADTFDEQADLDSSPNQGHRGVLQKQATNGDNESLKGRKRFSKRQSKSGLTAVF